MAQSKYSIALGELVREYNLEVLHGAANFENIPIKQDDINRPGLQLVGFFDYFDPDRIQILGKQETTFLRRFTPERREVVFKNLFAKKIPALVLTRSIEPFPECLAMAKAQDVTLLRTSAYTSAFITSFTASLKMHLAPRITRHGVLVEVYGEGILILGDSGIGKSETAIELVKRGHRLIADDAVEIKKMSDQMLVGTAPALIRHYIELRGIGVIDVRRIFGMGAVKENEGIDMVVALEPWNADKQYDRMGLDGEMMNILDVEVPLLTVPVKPGRNLAVIIEVAAMNNRLKKMGHNAARELEDRVYDSLQG